MNADINHLKSIKSGVSMTGEIVTPQALPPQSLPEIELPYTKGGEFLDSYGFRIAFVYPQGRPPFCLKGGTKDVYEFLDDYRNNVAPYLAHVTTYRNFRGKGKSKEFEIDIGIPRSLCMDKISLQKDSKPQGPIFGSGEQWQCELPKHQKWVLLKGWSNCTILATFRKPPRAFPDQLTTLLNQPK